MQPNLEKIQAEFGARVCTLNTGSVGLRAGMKFTAKEIGGQSGTDPIMDFIGSDGSVDRYNEVIDQKGWQLENFRANPVIPDCHNYDTVGRILGRALSVEVKDGQLVNRVEFCVDNPLGLMAYKMAKGGFIKSQSVGFIPLEWVRGVNADQPERTYTQCELLEISLVVVPANPGATVGLALKSGAIERADVRAVMAFLKQLCGEDTGSDGTVRADAAEALAAQSLQVMRSLCRVLAS